ncbi:MAG: response regulator [Magnetococcus sp. YQC-5]
MNTISAKIKITFAVMAVVLFGTILFYYSIIMSSNEAYRKLLKLNFQEVELAQITEDFMLKASDEWEKKIGEPEFIEDLLNKAIGAAENLQSHQEIHDNVTGAQATIKIIENMRSFLNSFQLLIQAWNTKGLNYYSGLFGVMRDNAHALEAMLGNYDTAPLQSLFVQMRTSEKNFIIGNKIQYIEDINRLHAQFVKYLKNSKIEKNTQQKIIDTILEYMNALATYTEERQYNDTILDTNNYKNLDNASQSLNTLLHALFVPNALYDYLQARRHEKDYLVRMEAPFLAKMHNSLASLRDNIRNSDIPSYDKEWIFDQVKKYEEMFLKVVEQEQSILLRTQEMRERNKVIRKLIHAIVQDIKNRTDSAFEDMGHDLEYSIHSGLLVSLIIFLMMILLIWSFASTNITKPLKDLKAATVAIGKGNLNTDVYVHNIDEIGAVALALGKMARELAEKSRDLEQAYAYNENILSSISDTLIIMTPDGIINRFNRNDLLGCTQQGVMDLMIGDLIVAISNGKEQELVSVLKRNKYIYNGEAFLIQPNKTKIPILVSTSVLMKDSNTVQNVLVMIKDITALKEVTIKLEQAKREADAANKAKSLFVANMSHEIRTPMNAILGMTHLCLQTKTTSQQKDYLEKIYNAANGLLRIINEILDFSKIEAGKLEVESVAFHLDDVLRDLSTMATMRAHQKEVEVIFYVARGVPRTLIGDPLRLGQILINLSSNAVKFTESGEIVISVERVSETDTTSTLRFKVKDTGIGMTDQQISRLFQAFSQADDSTTRKYGGTGLGLTISKRLVELMGGEIRVDSKMGQGTTFQFTIRFDIPKHSERRYLTTPEKALGKRILVVDDNQTSREMLYKTLQSFSLDVEVAASGPIGLEKLESAAHIGNPFDLLLVDWHMPEMNGIEMLHHVQANQSHPNLIPCLMTTIAERGKILHHFENADHYKYIDKPINISALFDVIMSAFGLESFLHPRKQTNQHHMNHLNIKGAKILLVEDNEINQQVAKELLELAGITVTIVGNGLEAIRMTQTSAFDLVLMDLQMPEMDGFDATKKIRHTYNVEQLPIIAMTANVMSDDIARCLAVGMNDHIGKPIDPQKLYVTLNLWIKPQDGVVSAIPFEQPPLSTTQAHPEALQVLPGIDIDIGLARVAGNMVLFKTLLQKFAENHANTINEIRMAIHGGDHQLAWRLAHTLKGVAGSIGANRLYMLAKECELKLKSNKECSDDLFPDILVEEMQFVLQSIARLQVSQVVEHLPAEETVQEKRRVGDIELRQILSSLLPHIEKRRPKHCTPILEELEKLLLPARIVSEVNTMIHLIKNYKYKESLSALNMILNKLDAHSSHDV